MKSKKDDNMEKKTYIRPQTCRNCGINGHLYKDCLHPIMSFGIICYTLDKDEIKYLMIQRKDSISFMEFIRGKYNTNEIDYISKLISSMTNNEKYMLLNKNFDDIWNYVWCQNNLSTFKHTNEYLESKQKFEYLSSNKIFNEINITNNDDIEQEWGFPKGRRKLKEDDMSCALRELYEETRLKEENIILKKDIDPFEELFYGTNNVLYKHTYYISKLLENNTQISIDKTCIEQMREIRALKWFSYDEVLQHIKKHNIERIEIFKEINKLIKNIEKKE